jgi:hypothetical protein
MKHHRVGLFKSGVFLISLTCMLTFVAFGCATMKKGPEGPIFQPASATEKEITVSIRQLGRDELIKKYKEVDNPYLTESSLFGGEMFVFELAISAPIEIKLILKTIEFHFGPKFTPPINPFHLSEYWKSRIQSQNSYRGWTSARVTYTINKTMLPEKLIVNPDESRTGLVVFMGRFPEYGEASLFIPVYTKNDELIHLFKL